MAKKKKKAKTKPAAAASEEAVTEETSAEAGEEEEGDEGAAQASDDEQQEAVAQEKERPRIEGRGRSRGAPAGAAGVDPLIPSPDGPRVSSKGGLVFVAVILALVVLAIVAQFTIGQ